MLLYFLLASLTVFKWQCVWSFSKNAGAGQGFHVLLSFGLASHMNGQFNLFYFITFDIVERLKRRSILYLEAVGNFLCVNF